MLPTHLAVNPLPELFTVLGNPPPDAGFLLSPRRPRTLPATSSLSLLRVVWLTTVSTRAMDLRTTLLQTGTTAGQHQHTNSACQPHCSAAVPQGLLAQEANSCQSSREAVHKLVGHQI